MGYYVMSCTSPVRRTWWGFPPHLSLIIEATIAQVINLYRVLRGAWPVAMKQIWKKKKQIFDDLITLSKSAWRPGKSFHLSLWRTFSNFTWESWQLSSKTDKTCMVTKKSKDSFFNWEQFLQSESEFRKRGFKFMKGRFTANERFKPCLEDE